MRLSNNQEKYLETLEKNLPELYFGEQDESKGIYGDITKMFEFHKNNIEAFPIFAIPLDYVNKLGEIARRRLLERIRDNPFDRNPTKITANMSFFLSREGDENQSPYLLLARTPGRYRLVSLERVKEAFNLSSGFEPDSREGERKLKAAIQESLTKQKHIPGKVKELFVDIVNSYEDRSKEDAARWSVGYCRGKALQLSPAEVVGELLYGCQMGYISFG